MKKISLVVLYFFAAVALAWFLPWLYALLTPENSPEPFAAWSPVGDCWILSQNDVDRNTFIWAIDGSGDTIAVYSKNQRDSMLPQLYYKDLMARSSLADTIAGMEVTVPALRHREFVFSSNPREVNKPSAGVWMMMESMPLRADLEDPTEVFTMNGSMEFIDMATNEVNVSRSRRFTDALRSAGFTWPMTSCSANITSRKQRDDGYLMSDVRGAVFHVSQKGGRPYVAKVNFPDSLTVTNVFIFENTDPSILGMAVDSENRPWFILREGYRAVPLEVDAIDPTADRINVMGNMFNIVFRVSSDGSTRWTAISSDDFSLLGTYSYNREKSRTSRISRFIFPFRLNFNSASDSYVYPRLSGWSLDALWLNVILSVIIAIVMRRRNCSVSRIAVGSVLVIPLGLYMFIPAMLIRE